MPLGVLHGNGVGGLTIPEGPRPRRPAALSTARSKERPVTVTAVPWASGFGLGHGHEAAREAW